MAQCILIPPMHLTLFLTPYLFTSFQPFSYILIMSTGVEVILPAGGPHFGFLFYLFIFFFFVFIQHEIWCSSGLYLEPLLFNVIIKDICDSVCSSTCVLFAEGFSIFRCIRNFEESKILQSDVDALRQWGLGNGMKLNADTTTFISFIRKTDSGITCAYKLGLTHIARSAYVNL